MARSRGAHAAPGSGRKKTFGWIAALALGTGGLLAWSPWSGDASTPKAGSTPSRSNTTGAANSTNPHGCPDPLSFWTGVSRDPYAVSLDSAFVSSLGKTCPPATADRASAADAKSAGVTLTVPDAPVTDAVASTPVVLAMPKAMATELGWPGPLMPGVVQDLFTDKRTWKSMGHPEWGAFRIAAPDPAKTLVGSVAFGTLTALANGGTPVTKAPNYYQPTRADIAVVHSEQKITTVTESLDEANALLDAATPDEFARTVSAVVTTERDVIAHNASDPQVQFVSIPLGAGAATVPITVTATEAGGSAATAFAGYARTPAGTIALQAAGWRSPAGGAPTVGTDSTGQTPISPANFDADAIKSIRYAWGTMHTHGSTMALIDLSGSMNLDFPGSAYSRLGLVKQLTARAYTLASPKAASTVWFFRTSQGHDLIDSELPLELNDTPTGAGRIHSDDVLAQVKAAQAGGGTPLYLAVKQAYAHATKNYREGYLNQLLVLTDGTNEATANSVTIDQLLSSVKKLYNPKKPVTISYLLIDPQGRIGPLKRVADATGGVSVPVRSMADVPRAYAQALFASGTP
ncbi:MAG: substrate-binding domain-containing protein [Dermatophilaceae bacterium]